MYGVRNEVHACIIARDEFELFGKLIDVFREHDPDIVFGWETEILSIGYLCKRAEFGLGFKFKDFIQREARTYHTFNQDFYRKRFAERLVPDDSYIPEYASKNFVRAQQQDAAGPETIKGRVIINVWRYMRMELQLTNYDLDNVCFHILKRRIPSFSFQTLSKWWRQGQHQFP
jgi:DNA polymerase zeta